MLPYDRSTLSEPLPGRDGSGSVSGSPTQSEQLDWPQRFRHVQHQEKTVPPGSSFKSQPELFPRQDLLILGPKISWSLQLPSRIIDKEILIDDFSEDRLQVGPSLLGFARSRCARQALPVRPLREAAYQRARLAEAARGYLLRGNLEPATSTVCHAAIEARAAGDEGYAGTGW